jgi:chromosome segregation ATPase
MNNNIQELQNKLQIKEELMKQLQIQRNYFTEQINYLQREINECKNEINKINIFSTKEDFINTESIPLETLLNAIVKEYARGCE